MIHSIMQEVQRRWYIILIVCLIQIAIHLINIFTGYGLNQFGILPRNMSTWYGVFFAPWLHSSIGHLVGNLVGLSVFSVLCLVRSVSFYFFASFFIIVVSGVAVWLFGRPAYHVGASGWIYGLWALSLALAWFERSILSIVIGLAVLALYSGMMFGLFPQRPGISFEGHIYGAAAGILFAYIFSQVDSKIFSTRE